jgi:hypothetical protein
MFEDPREWTAYRLANEAECAGPDSSESAGAKMLQSVRDAVVDAWEYNDKDVSEDAAVDIISEAADNGPDIYTHTLWQEFADLCAYREDPTDLGFDGSDMQQGARICLYLIAERCANAVMSALREIDDEDDNDETDQS